ncbi:MAG: matrixin family metalloprotease [Oligoflexia bacterium]|nr:matrixin family metalloprotease [Oligoflexia bacterium]
MLKILVSLLLILDLKAFTLNYSNEAHFQVDEVTIDVAGNSCATAGYNSAAELLDAAFEAANEFWNRVPTCALKLKKGSVRSSVDISSDSLGAAIAKANTNTILIGCSDNSSIFSAGILGVANINANNQNQAAVLINNVDTSFANLDAREKLATIAHEMGHALGVGHSSDPVALMYASVGGKVQEKLTMDDYNACTYLYPHDSPGSCSAVPFIGKSPKGPQDPNNFIGKSKNTEEKSNANWPFNIFFGFAIIVLIFGLKRDRFYRL